MSLNSVSNPDSNPDSKTAISRRQRWPSIAARSTASDCSDLLTALLATRAFDEISDIENLESVENYITHEGSVDGGRTRKGMTFWLYPTGLHGPCHYLEGGAVECHGILLTVEPGVDVKAFMSELRNRLTKNGVYHGPRDGITHEHFAASK